MRISGFLIAVLSLALMIGGPALARDGAPHPPAAQDVPIALLVDMSSGQVLHQRNADRRFMPASITKTMTAFLAFELIEQGKLRPEQRFPVSRAAFAQWHGKGSTMFLAQDARPSVDQLLMGIMNVSANDGAVVLAEGAAGSVEQWVALMNEKARELGMSNSHFETPNGWMDDGRTFVSARDLVTLAAAMITRHPRLYARYVGHRQFTYEGITQPNHDPLIGRVRGADGIKTGFTNEAGMGYLGSIRRDGRRLLMVVAGADRGNVRNRAARDYAEWGFAHFAARPLFGLNEIVGKAKVQGGSARQVALRPQWPIMADMPRGTQPQIRLAIHYDGPVRAPITAGEQVAELEISVAGMEPSRVPLVAAADVQQAGFFGRIWNGIAGWLT